MDKIHFQLVTPQRTVLNQELDSLSCPTSLGEITILPGHVPLVANLVSGELVGRANGEEMFINVSGGFVEIRANNQVVILADAAEHHYEIDEQRAQAAIERAKNAMRQHKLSEAEYAKVAAALERGLSRVNVARKHARRKGPLTSQNLFSE